MAARLRVPGFWEEPFGRLAGDVELPTSTLKEAEQEARAFIAAIAAAPAQ